MASVCSGKGDFLHRIRLLSAAQLKTIAVISMLLDHCNKALLLPHLHGGFPAVLSSIFSALGRIAFPVFCFFLVEGFFKTKNRTTYLRNLFLFALLSEIPFDLFTSARWCNWSRNNVLFTFCLILLTIWMIDSARSAWADRPVALWLSAAVLLSALMGQAAILLGVDYQQQAIVIGCLFYLFHDRPILAVPLCFLTMYQQPWTLPGFLLTLTYNGQRGRQPKFFFYSFYPLHMLALVLLRHFWH